MIFRFLALAVLSLAVAAPAFAQSEKPQAVPAPVPAPAQPPAAANAGITFPEHIIKGEIAYAQALQKLTEPQKTQLKALDQDFTVTMVPAMEIYDMGGKLLFCLGTEQEGSRISAKQEEYVKTFKHYQLEKGEEQRALWRQHSVAAVKVGYIDHALMDKHYAYIETAQKAAAEQMVDKAVRTGVYQHVSCAEIQKILDETEIRRQKAASSGTLGTSPK